MQFSNIGAGGKLELGEPAVERRRHEQLGYDHKGVVVVASAWLFLYVLLFSGLTIKHGTEVLASISEVLP
jgi:hypothetical protein